MRYFVGRNRQRSMQFGLVIPVCRHCHQEIDKDQILNEKLHKIGQVAFGQFYKSNDFIKFFGKNYL